MRVTRAYGTAKSLSGLNFPHPLDYAYDKDDDVFDALLQTISANEKDITDSLPNCKQFKTTPKSLAKLLFNISKPFRLLPYKAPVLRKGSFLLILEAAHKSLLFLTDRQNMGNKEDFVMSCFKLSFRTFKIHYFFLHHQ